jgi:hypothetical protein
MTGGSATNTGFDIDNNDQGLLADGCLYGGH